MHKIWIGLLLLAGPVGCGQARDWAFIQAVGGMTVAKPLLKNDQLFLPLRVNVSGTEQITVKPTMLNSGLVCESVRVNRQNNEIGLTINTGQPRPGLHAHCPTAALGKLPPGTYQIFYLNPDGSRETLGGFTLAD